MIAMGLMSGTSADGVSAALVEIGNRTVKVLRHRDEVWSAAEQKRIIALNSATAGELSEANFWIGRRFARAAKNLMRGFPAKKIRVIGSHGQTVHHQPGKHTLQLGEPSIIAEETGIDVVADFRPRDIAAGGQGAPLVPFFDDFVYGASRHFRAALNIGGIANVTFVGGRRPPVAFDTGPGNCLIDDAVRLLTHDRQTFDRGGRIAKTGKLDEHLLDRLMCHPYLGKVPPKSTGRELFSRNLVRSFGRVSADTVTTLTFFTARSIADAIDRFGPKPLHEVIVSGGGALNAVMIRHLDWMVFPAVVRPSSVYGIGVMAKECAAFALLAARAIEGKTNTVPSATGARRAVVAGKMVPGGKR